MELLSEIHQAGNTVIFVTHNPELTRYATRVVYMQDGMIKQDEKKPLGQVGRYAYAVTYPDPASVDPEEDDAAGVSALMKVHALSDETRKKSRRSAPKRRKSSTRRKKAGKA